MRWRKTSWAITTAIITLLSTSLSFAQSQPSPSQLSEQLTLPTTMIQCGEGQTASAILGELSANGGMYIKLAAGATRQTVRLFHQSITGSCSEIATVEATADTWTAVPIPGPEVTSEAGSLILSGPSLSSDPFATAGHVMILQDSSICIPTDDCEVLYKGIRGVLTPLELSSSADTLKLYQLTWPREESFKRVDYFVDGSFAYSRSYLEEINQYHVPIGTHTIKRIVEFDNGQQIIIGEERKVEANAINVIPFVPWLLRQEGSARIFAFLALALLLVLVVILIIRLIRYKKHYEVDHGYDNIHFHGYS